MTADRNDQSDQERPPRPLDDNLHQQSWDAIESEALGRKRSDPPRPAKQPDPDARSDGDDR